MSVSAGADQTATRDYVNNGTDERQLSSELGGVMAAEKEEEECCMCGDIGFSKDLLPCLVCGFRLQHRYCSSSYPNIDLKTWRCEWCVREEEKREPRSRRGKGVNPPLVALLDIAGCREPDETDRGMSESGDTKHCRKGEENYKQPLPTARSPKQRKYKGPDRLKKLNCNPSSSRVACRRYKLLADVMC